ncbi:craniofacial development protein 2-like [Palaemon carinicauda]|uniref:craniofacial development protein 2-like n=1 Tax=Palaemon carinicauda TaxID=392227 RepID=UPI0035B64D79
MSSIVCYALTNDSSKEGKVDTMKIGIGDLNAKVGRNNQGIENVMGVGGLAEVAHENGANFISFFLTNNVVFVLSLFEHNDIRKYTWALPCGNYENQIDHIAINIVRKRKLRDARSSRDADIDSDHQLIATLK